MAVPEYPPTRTPPKVIAPSRIVARSISIWWRTMPQLLAIAAIVHLPLLAVKWWLAQGQEESLRALVSHFMPVLDLTVAASVIEGLAVLLIFKRLRREPADVARSVRQGTRRLGTILAIAAIVLAVLVVIPTTVAIVSGFTSSSSRGLGATGVSEFVVVVMVLGWLTYSLVFSVTIPAAIVEGHGAVKAFNRSRVLTSGARGRIFGMWFLFGLATGVPTRILQMIVESIQDPTTALLAGAVLDWFVAALTCVVPIVLYHDLREAKEGIGIEELLKVFE